ncbi:hypothetical protein [Lacrimispora amygdalina]|uniref:hypothetical protein n=1 Tax=Lacrimispora amygdalina TaxID=253257 RepID=UPI000BE28C69|nr:hypothetical protein [Lacrimispora amygdalina]
MKFYTTPEQLGLINPTSIVDVINAMADNSVLFIRVADDTPAFQTLCPKYWGLLEIVKLTIYRVNFKFSDVNKLKIISIKQIIMKIVGFQVGKGLY